MVAPLIVGTARVVKGGAKIATKAGSKATTKRIGTTRLLQQTLSSENQRLSLKNSAHLRRAIRHFNTLTDIHEGEPSASTNINRARAIAVGASILWTVLPVSFIPQLLFYSLELGGLGIQVIPFVNELNLGTLVFLLSYIVIIAIGLMSMAYGAVVYLRTFVDCFSGTKLLIFISCLTGYFIPFLNFIPWLVFWIFAVSYLQESKKSEDTVS